jgi:hypothetical protein
MPPVLAQHLDEQVTGRVGDVRLLTEVRRTGHEDQHLHDPDPVQIAHRLHSGGESVERGMAGQGPRRLQLDVTSDYALAQQPAVLVGQLARDVDAGVHRPVVHVVRVVGEFRKGEAQGLKPSGGRTGARRRGHGLAHRVTAADGTPNRPPRLVTRTCFT